MSDLTTNTNQQPAAHPSLLGVGINKRRPTNTPNRHVALTSVRLFAANLYAVATTDDTGRLADPRSLMLSTDLEKARLRANHLLTRLGGPAPNPTEDSR